ncbi:MAG: hypothetical protein LUQ05_06100 [Methanoregula sp.]|jgi:hypothetical protein|nr:hypothetical protein [Methanoregula sp.]
MRFERYALLFTVLVILLAWVCGCTTTPNTGTGPAATTAPGVPPRPSYTEATSAYQAAKSSGLETTINIHYNDFNCLDLQKELGVDYLYPDQMYTIWATSPSSGTINVNVLLLKVNDYEKIQTVRPSWDTVKKTWVYDGISPLIQLNDISIPQEKTITIKNQGKYFLCADDRKESGINDAIFRVPVKITRL